MWVLPRWLGLLVHRHCITHTDAIPTAQSIIVLATIGPKDTLEQDLQIYTDIHDEAVKSMGKVAVDVSTKLKKLKHNCTSIVSLSGKFVDGLFRSRV